ncbi:MAG: DUF4390 domain-containing protein [Candidatus Accumulibacter sp.]|jgi:hypothetical protein|nr:DUF4390 domain-containing protein [Accumulibacter sp.]
MAFIMRFCERLLEALFLSLFFALSAEAAGIDVRESHLSMTDKGCELSAEFGLPFNARLEEAISKGVVLHFVLDFELERARWYWWNEDIVRKSRTYRISYHALTREYRLSTGALYQRFDSLADALARITRVRDWRVAGREDLVEGETYQAGLWMRLDLSSMPKTFQVDALSNRDWDLSSGWHRWKFVVPETRSDAAPLPAAETPADAAAETEPEGAP